MEFIKLGKYIFNKKYIKYIICNETECCLIIRNTENRNGNKYDTLNSDTVFKYNKEKDPLEYNKLKNLFNTY